jgi:tetratricopeptide (TPR) repeat protein
VAPDKAGARKEGPVPRRPDSTGTDAAARKAASSGIRPAVQPPAAPPPQRAGREAEPSAAPTAAAPQPSQIQVLLRKPAVLAGLGAVVLVLLVFVAWRLFSGTRVSAKESNLKAQAEQLWLSRQFDQSEQTWRELAKIKGPLQAEAIRSVNHIEQKRADEQRRFDEGESLLNDKKDYAGAQQAFEDVAAMSLWHVGDAQRELAVAKAGLGASDVAKQEKDHFDAGVQFFQNKDYDKASKEFHAALDLNVANSELKAPAEDYLKKIRQSANEQKLFDTAMEQAKNEAWADARDQFQEVINRKGPQSGEAKKQMANVQKALDYENRIEEAIKEGAYRTAKSQLDSSQQWPKTHDKLAGEIHAAEQHELETIRANAQNAESKSDVAAIQHTQDELHGFQGRVVEQSFVQASHDLDKGLSEAFTKAQEKAGDKAAFDTAVAHFEQAVQKKDVGLLNHQVHDEFQKIANGSGIFKANAQLYLTTTIPNAIQTLAQSTNKAPVPPISCGSGQGPSTAPTLAGGVSCAQLDQNAPLSWIGNYMVDFPDVPANKFPYTLNLWVIVDQAGNVKIERDGNVEKAFFNKAKDACKHWKTTVPKSGGKPVSVRFPLSITFKR